MYAIPEKQALEFFVLPFPTLISSRLNLYFLKVPGGETNGYRDLCRIFYNNFMLLVMMANERCDQILLADRHIS
jgi:hypothetical protein